MALYSTKDFSRLLGTPGFSDGLLKQHFDLYAGYVKNANALHDELEASSPAKPPTPAWSELKRRFGWEWNGMRLHETYFENMTKSARAPVRDTPLAARLAKDFGSREAWEKQFRATGSLGESAGRRSRGTRPVTGSSTSGSTSTTAAPSRAKRLPARRGVGVLDVAGVEVEMLLQEPVGESSSVRQREKSFVNREP